MSLHNRLSVPPSEQAAVEDSGGCLTVLLMPVMAIGLVSIIMMCVFGGLTVPPTPSSNALAAPAAAANLVAPSPESVVQDTGGLSNVFTIEVQHWNVSILRWASETGLDPNLIATVMQIESCGDPRAVSRVGAMGLFQVMPYHFYGDDDPYNPDTNAARGLAYLLKSITKSGGDVRLALAGYNGGVGVIGRSENAWAAETQRYAYWGSGIYNDAIQGTTESERLLEWLAASGASLCQQAHQRLGLP